MKDFYLIPDYGWLGGVCSGIAYYFKIKVWIVRLLCFCSGFGGVYLLVWFFAPNIKETPKDYSFVCE